MGVKIRLQNHGCQNFPYWWIVVQGHKTNPKGRILEKIGMWWPRNTARYRRSIVINRHRIKYWIGVGAVPTPGAHRVLAQAEMIPRLPIPFGSSSVYPKSQAVHPNAFIERNVKTPTLDRLNKMNTRSLAMTEVAQLAYHARLNAEAIGAGSIKEEDLASGGLEYVDDILNVEKYKRTLQGVHTSEIDSDEPDFLTRKRNFEELRRRMEQNRSESELMHFKDYKYNMYARKMKKLVQVDNGIDTEGYFELMKTARQIAQKEREELESQSKIPSTDREYTYNPESFGGSHAQMEMIHSELDQKYKTMKEHEYKMNLHRLKEYHYIKKKMADPEYKKTIVHPDLKYQPHKQRYGRYPPGYQHFENPQKYLLKFPDRTIGHYHAHMNRDCTFYEYVDVMVSQRIQDIRYEITKRQKRNAKQHEDVYNPLKPEQKTRIVNEIFDDPETREQLMNQFNGYLRLANHNGSTFTFVDCLEMFAHLYDIPVESIGEGFVRDTEFFPTRKGLPPLPKMDPDGEPLNVSRLGPTTLQYPFKAYTAPNRYMVRPLRLKKVPVSFSRNGRYYTKYAKYRGAHKWHPKEP